MLAAAAGAMKLIVAGAHGPRRTRPRGGFPDPADGDADRVRKQRHANAQEGAHELDHRRSKVRQTAGMRGTPAQISSTGRVKQPRDLVPRRHGLFVL